MIMVGLEMTGTSTDMPSFKIVQKNDIESQNAKIGKLFKFRLMQSALLSKRKSLCMDDFDRQELCDLNKRIASMYLELIRSGIPAEKILSRMKTLEIREARKKADIDNNIKAASLRKGGAGAYLLGNSRRHWK